MNTQNQTFAPEREGEIDQFSPDFLVHFYLAWKELEDQIQDLQNSKKSMIANFVGSYERHQAKVLKPIMRRTLMNEKKWAEAAMSDEMPTYSIGLLDPRLVRGLTMFDCNGEIATRLSMTSGNHGFACQAEVWS